MAANTVKHSCILVSTLLLSVSLPYCGHAAAGKTGSTEPVTTTSIVRQPEGYSSEGHEAAVTVKPTDPVTVTSAIPEPTQEPTDPVTTTSRNPAGVSSKSTVVEKQAAININDNVVMVSGQLSMGYANGASKELVYDPRNGHKNSELDWNIDQVFMVGAGISVKPLSWLRFNANAWFRASDGNGNMDDYDWQLYDWNNWTDWSHSSVAVTEGAIYDLNTELTFLRFNETAFFGILGYRHDHWKWEAKGGNYIYSSYYVRDTVGSFPDDLMVLTYEQTFDVPYLGVGFRANLNPFTLSGRVIGSSWVKAKDEDHHPLRDLTVTSSMSSGNMFGVDFACTYNFTPHLAATAAYQYQRYEELKGSKDWNFYSEGVQFQYGGGMDNESSILSLSVLYTF